MRSMRGGGAGVSVRAMGAACKGVCLSFVAGERRRKYEAESAMPPADENYQRTHEMKTQHTHGGVHVQPAVLNAHEEQCGAWDLRNASPILAPPRMCARGFSRASGCAQC